MISYDDIIFTVLLLISLYLAYRYFQQDNIEYFTPPVETDKNTYLHGISCSYVDKTDNKIKEGIEPSKYISMLLQNIDCIGTEEQNEMKEMSDDKQEERKDMINDLNEEITDYVSENIPETIEKAYESLNM
tara:strand:+ start:109 stop:501 length:393 start_codon:yes stop_codon:yes gene_type:complete